MCCTDQCDPIGLQQALMASFSLPVPLPVHPLPPLLSLSMPFNRSCLAVLSSPSPL